MTPQLKTPSWLLFYSALTLALCASGSYTHTIHPTSESLSKTEASYSNGTSSYDTDASGEPPTASNKLQGSLTTTETSAHQNTAPTDVLPSDVGSMDEYYSAYEYPDTATNSSATVFKNTEPGVIPDPGIQESPIRSSVISREEPSSQEEEDEEVEEQMAALSDDSMLDKDLHDHDLIDSVMYIYFGATPHSEGGAGRQVLIVGAGISLIAQILALATAVMRIRMSPRDPANLILLHTELALASCSLVFVLGVQATGDKQWCEAVAITLHYLHLVICCWFFMVSIHVYQQLHQEMTFRIHLLSAVAWLLPALLVLGCFILDPRGYETRRYCWMSAERGMLVSFMVPVATLIMVNTIVTVMCVRVLSQCDLTKLCIESHSNHESLRKSLRAAAMLLPTFAVIWFLGVVALENPSTHFFPVMFAAVDGFLNWFVCICSSVVLPQCASSSVEELEISSKAFYPEPDSQPLLTPDNSSSPLWDTPVHRAHSLSPSPHKLCLHQGGSELLELRLDTISTISS